MKRISRNIYAIMGRLCSAAVALLGFSCSDEGEATMYGTPTGTFEIKGTVTTEDGKDVGNAEMRVTYPEAPSGIVSIDISKSKTDGSYTLDNNKEYVALTPVKVVCLPDDPALEPDSVMVNLDYIKDKHDKDSWNMGHAEATVDFRLKKKGNAE